MAQRFFLLLAFIIFLAATAAAQATRPSLDPKPLPRPRPDQGSNGEDQGHMSLPEEMRIKMEIERANSEYKKFVEDVDKLNDLSAEVAKSYGEHGKLSSEEVKKLGTIEKLAKRVLSHAGGDEVDDKSGKTTAMTVSDAVAQLTTAATNIKNSVKAETRYVVSATVIASSNEVINLAQHLRRALKTD
jgi:hypothetical protein